MISAGSNLLETLRIENQHDEFLFAVEVVDAMNKLLELHGKLCSSQGNDCINDVKEFS
ncbi:hypothetical protein [Wolbachia pipientis]|uniref:hypothetical protein n=1 Tax=Wolbachia pipientis TaxID=955 RepID=UPI0025A4B85E|nr:hypothetical protein [Wolbachia pipientis]MDM8335610.1 hypothetical protein [Wolbachia pipientis]